MKFSIGDKVRVISEYGSASVGDEGIIKALPWENGSISYQSCYAVEFPSWSYGHDCNGKVPSKKGLWVLPECLELIEKRQPRIVITHDSKTTTAKLYDGKEITKTAEAKCSPDDKFDFAAGAKLAFERLMGEVEPKFDKSMLTTGRFGYMRGGQGWFVVVGERIVYQAGGYDEIEKMDTNGEFRYYHVECIVDARSFAGARDLLRKNRGIVWMRPGFDPKKAV